MRYPDLTQNVKGRPGQSTATMGPYMTLNACAGELAEAPIVYDDAAFAPYEPPSMFG